MLIRGGYRWCDFSRFTLSVTRLDLKHTRSSEEKKMKSRIAVAAALVLVGTSRTSLAQQPSKTPAPDCSSTAVVDHSKMDHEAHAATMERCGAVPTSPGQAAFGAISEVVRMLKADAKTDWAKVNIEALRQHLIDMDEVTMRSAAAQRNIPGGIEVDVTGTGRTTDAIRRMTLNHSAMLNGGTEYNASAKEIPGGARLTVTAKNAADASAVARIRGLGFAGIMTEGDHHAAHHLAVARGETVHRH
jgi:hypothetical protein